LGAHEGTNQDNLKQRKVLAKPLYVKKIQSNPADMGSELRDVSEPASSLSSGRLRRGSMTPGVDRQRFV
jgi:hypothetical protein